MQSIIHEFLINWQASAILIFLIGAVVIAILKTAKNSNMTLKKGGVTFKNAQEAIKEVENKYFLRGKYYREMTARIEKDIRKLAYFEKPERMRAIRDEQMRRFASTASTNYIDNMQKKFEENGVNPQALGRDLGRIHLITELLTYRVKEILATITARNHFATGNDAEFKQKITEWGEVLFSEVENLIDTNHPYEVIDANENREYHKQRMPEYYEILATLMNHSRQSALLINDKIGALLKTIELIEITYNKNEPLDSANLADWKEKGRQKWLQEKVKNPEIIYDIENLI